MDVVASAEREGGEAVAEEEEDEADVVSPDIPLLEILDGYRPSIVDKSGVNDHAMPRNQHISYILAFVVPPSQSQPQEEEEEEPFYLDVYITKCVSPVFALAAGLLISFQGEINDAAFRTWAQCIRDTGNDRDELDREVVNASKGELEMQEEVCDRFYDMDNTANLLSSALRGVGYRGSWIFAFEHVTDVGVYRVTHGGGFSDTFPGLCLIKQVLDGTDPTTGALNTDRVSRGIGSAQMAAGIFAESAVMSAFKRIFMELPPPPPSPVMREEEDGYGEMDMDAVEAVLREMEQGEHVGDDENEDPIPMDFEPVEEEEEEEEDQANVSE